MEGREWRCPNGCPTKGDVESHKKAVVHFETEARALKAAIVTHRAQKADDRCIEDDDRLYAALEDGIKCDRRVGDKAAMLHNCERFIERRCEAGGWPTYAEIEAQRDRAMGLLKRARNFMSPLAYGADIYNKFMAEIDALPPDHLACELFAQYVTGIIAPAPKGAPMTAPDLDARIEALLVRAEFVLDQYLHTLAHFCPPSNEDDCVEPQCAGELRHAIADVRRIIEEEGR